jgi:hypothetical protein
VHILHFSHVAKGEIIRSSRQIVLIVTTNSKFAQYFGFSAISIKKHFVNFFPVAGFPIESSYNDIVYRVISSSMDRV